MLPTPRLIPRIAALLGPVPTLASGETASARGWLRYGGEVLQIDPSGEPGRDLSKRGEESALRVMVTGASRPSAVPEDVDFVLASGTVWARSGQAHLPGDWVAMETIGVSDGTLARNHAVLETSLLADTSVAIIGLGSGGAIIADQLARAGVGHLVLIDRDRLEVHNVGRHLCDLGDLGRRKTAAVADRLRLRNPGIRLDLVDLDVMEDEDKLSSAVEGCSVLVAATDSNPSRSLINRLAVDSGTVAIFGFAQTRAAAGDVIRVSPKGPCWDCIFPHAAPQTEISSARSPGAAAYADVPVHAEPGLALDIQPIALMCARLTLQELVRGRGSALESLDEDLPGSRFLWVNRREGNFAGWKPMGNGVREFAVHRWYGMKVERNPLCPTCNEQAFLEGMLAGDVCV